VLRRSAAYLTGLPRRSRTLESLEHRCFLAVAAGPEIHIQPPMAPFELRAETGPVARPATDGSIEQRVVLVPVELPTNPEPTTETRHADIGPIGLLARSLSFEQHVDAGPSNPIFNSRPSLEIQHDLASDASLGTVHDVGEFTEVPAFAPGYLSSPNFLMPSGFQASQRAVVLHEDVISSNGADVQVQSELDVGAETMFIVPFAARDGVFARFGADSEYHFDVSNMAPRPGPVLGLESRPQPSSVQATTIIQHANEDANPQDTDAQFSGGAFAASSAAVMLTMTKSGLAGTSDAILRWSPVSTALDALALGGDRKDPTLDRAFFAAASHHFLAQPIVSRGALLLAGALPDVDAPWQWSSALPQAPRLSIDAEKLGQALEAVLADIDELGDSITDSLDDGDRVYWSLAAGGVACYVAGRHLQSREAPSSRATASSRVRRGERVPARRLFLHGWLPLRYPKTR